MMQTDVCQTHTISQNDGYTLRNSESQELKPVVDQIKNLNIR